MKPERSARSNVKRLAWLPTLIGMLSLAAMSRLSQAQPPARDQQIAEIQKQIDDLSKKLDEIKKGDAAKPETKPEPKPEAKPEPATAGAAR